MSDDTLVQSKAWPRAYSDDEVIEPPNDGQVYYNATEDEFRVWYSGRWNALSTGTPPPWPQIPNGWQPPTDWPRIDNIVNTNILPWPLHIKVNCGGAIPTAPTANGWTNDLPMLNSMYSGGSQVITTPINLLTADDPAPEAIYQSNYWGISFGTVDLGINRLNPNYTYTVRLHLTAFGTDPDAQRVDIRANFDTVTNYSSVENLINNPNYISAMGNADVYEFKHVVPTSYTFSASPVGTVTDGIYIWLSRGSASTMYGPSLFGVEVICESDTYTLPATRPTRAGFILTDANSAVIPWSSMLNPTTMLGPPNPQVSYDFYFSDGNAVLNGDFVGPSWWVDYNPDPTKDFESVYDLNNRIIILGTQYGGYDIYPIDTGALYHYSNWRINGHLAQNNVNLKASITGPMAASGTAFAGQGYNSCRTLCRWDHAGAYLTSGISFRNCSGLAFFNMPRGADAPPFLESFNSAGNPNFSLSLGLQKLISQSQFFRHTTYYGQPTSIMWSNTWIFSIVVPQNWVPRESVTNIAWTFDLTSVPNMSIYALANIINNAGDAVALGVLNQPLIVFGPANLAKLTQDQRDMLTAKGFIGDF